MLLQVLLMDTLEELFILKWEVCITNNHCYNTFVHVHTFTCTYICMYMYIHLHLHVHTSTSTCTRTYICMYMYMYIHLHVHTSTCTCINMYTYIHHMYMCMYRSLFRQFVGRELNIYLSIKCN